MKTVKLMNRFMSIILMASLFMACSDDGVEGPIGPQGLMGEQGIEGPQGPAGIDGEALGVPGPQGEQGDQGPQGPAGSQGEQGPVGAQGEQGEQGAAGPQGPAGAEGADGADGTDGAQGPQGNPGTANVIYSDWFATELGSNIAGTGQTFDVDFPEFSTEIHNAGTVLVYGRRLVVNGGAINSFTYQLPVILTGSLQLNYYFRIENNPGRIRILVSSLDGGAVGDGTYIEQFRYVVIPGGVPSGGKSSTDFSKMTYAEIIAYFGIPE